MRLMINSPADVERRGGKRKEVNEIGVLLALLTVSCFQVRAILFFLYRLCQHENVFPLFLLSLPSGGYLAIDGPRALSAASAA